MASRSELLAIFRTAYLEGLRIDLTAEGLPTVKDGTPTPDLLASLQANRQAIIDILTEQGIGTNPENRATVRQYVVPDGCIARFGCHRLSWCSQALCNRSCNHGASIPEMEEWHRHR